MELNKELKRLKEIIRLDPERSDKAIEDIRKKYTSAEDKKIIDAFIRDGLKDLSNEIEEFTKEIAIRAKLAELSKIVPLSYIAKNYFGKSRYWINQKATGQIVNGKMAKFTPDEIKTLNFALSDIIKKIGSLTIVGS